MILKNGEKYSPTPTEIKSAEKLYDKNGHLVLVWHESRLYTDPQEMRATGDAEKARMSPPGLPVDPLTAVFNSKGETNTYRYYTSSAYNGSQKREVYEPKTIMFKDKMIVTDPELKLFFALFNPIVDGSIAGKNQKKFDRNYRPWLKIEIEEKVAEEKVNKRLLRKTVDDWILETATEEEIREIAAQFKVFNTQSEDLNILREKLFKILENTQFSGDVNSNYAKFKEKIDNLSDPELADKVAMVISKALEAKVLKYVNQSKAWNLIDEDGSVVETVVKLNANQVSKKEFILERHLANNPSAVKKILSCIPEKEEENDPPADPQ